MSATRRSLTRVTALALVPFIAIACGSEQPKSATVATGASTPSAAAETVTTVAAGSVAGPVVAVTYEAADSIFRSGDYARAADLFDSYTDRKPENPWGYYMTGLSAWKAGDLARAEVAFDEALELDPVHVKSLLNSGRVLIELDRPHEAHERIVQALELDTASSDGLRLLARAEYRMGRVDDAIETYRRAIAVDDRDVWAMNNLGLTLIEQGRPEEALGPLARAVQLRGTAPVFQNNLGVALERTGHTALAGQAYAAALAADSSYGKAAVSLARVSPLIDSAATDTLDLGEVAEEFRLQVRMWQDSQVRPAPVELEDEVMPDTIGMDSVQPDTVN